MEMFFVLRILTKEIYDDGNYKERITGIMI